ncbi:MAG: acyl-CoA dehydrogenase family protein [Desulfomonilia bacterium]|jgi:acyl-CoA dehydrogenase
MVSRREMKSLLEREPRFDDMMVNLLSVPKLPKAVVRETREAVALARKFNDEVVRPYALELDRKMQEDPGYLPWEFVKTANDWGFYSMWIPKMFGGKGYVMSSLSNFLEEIASACTAMANLIGVHYLGVATLSATCNLRLMNRVMRDTVEGEKAGDPRLISLAHTEPGAGTDAEEVELLDRGRPACRAQKVEGGYIVNGRKVFISNGHLSKWHMTSAYEDFTKPSENMVMFAVQNGLKGFSFGRQEHKMGQKGCPASELIFEDCFIPQEYVCIDRRDQAKLSRPLAKLTMQLVDYVVSMSRAGVAAFGTGVARGAYEEALRFASETEVDGKLLISHEWAQCMLAEMYKNVALGRLAYTETNYANGLFGFFKILQWKPLYYYYRYAPQAVLDNVVAPFFEHAVSTWLFRKLYFDWQKETEAQCTSGWGSLAKFVGTDIGMKNCQMALELMGQAGVRHDNRAEKHLRDSKLLQIYEGTNQLNRLNVFKCLIGRAYPQARVFED